MTEPKDKATEQQDGEKKTLSLSGKTLSLKGAPAGGAGRSVTPGRGGGPSVSVEVRRKREARPEDNMPQEDTRLTNEERASRERALNAAMTAGAASKSRLPKRQTTLKDRTIENRAAESAAPADRRAQELAELEAIEQEEGKKKEQAQQDFTRKKEFTNPAPTGVRRVEEEETESVRDRLKRNAVKAPAKRTEEWRGGQRITVSQALSGDFERDRGRSLAAQKRAREKARLAAMNAEPPKKVFREIILPETITVQELANRMSESGGEVVKSLMKMGVMATITQVIDADTAQLVAEELGHKVKRVTDADVEIGLEGEQDRDEDLVPRPPVVTIMGHVDHGKTSLLDALRQTDVVSGEAGGITQHIGAYQVKVSGDQKITFLDTPGHAAFTEMRARGANATDIVVIVVSAADSVMPQTVEAINHAKAAKVPLIVAINKIDLPDANPAKIKTDLLQYEVVVEEMGGDVQCVEISAKKKLNLDKLEEAILLQAEVLELRVNPTRPAQGVVIESKLEKGRGPVATILIQKGTLKIGDILVAGAESGRVRALVDDHGKSITQAIPGQPVEVLGLDNVPDSGDLMSVVSDEAKAREISSYRQRKRREMQAAQAVKGRTTMEQLLAQKEAGEKTVLHVVVKGDVHGSVEAIIGSLNKLVEENSNIGVQVLHSGVGAITESDVVLAKASNGLIIGFNVRAGAQARDLVARDHVNMRYYNIIYNVIDDVKAILTGMLSPNLREQYLGNAEILKVFNITKVGKVAGCMVKEGVVKRGAKVRLLRDNVVVHEGTLKTLKRHQDEVKEVKQGMECGMAFDNYDDMKESDVIECYEIVEEARTVQ